MPKKKEEKIKNPQNRLQRLKGFKDVMFEESRYWELVKKKASDLARIYGFGRVYLPVLESAKLYERSTGADTDIVSKEMYTFIDRNGEKVAMRPELTPGLVRAYIENGMFNKPQPVRFFWMGEVFRHENPQAGRLRQHTQFNLDVFGEENAVADAQLILIAFNFYRELQIDVQVQINSIGCHECRPEYIRELTAYYNSRGKKSKLCNDCKKRLVKNPLRLLDCKQKECQEIREDAPQLIDFLCEGCKEHFIKVLEYLDELEVPYNLDSFLVRGLDYYNRTVFEIITRDDEDSSKKRQISLGGGGRYDKLVELMGGREIPACGFGLGLERVILKIKEKNIPLKDDLGNIIFIAQLGEQARRKAFSLFEEMRRIGFNVRQLFVKDSLKAQLEEANRIKARFSLVLGQKEFLDDTIIVRDMESGTQEIIDYKKIFSEMDKRLKEKNN